jgi:hypothetical protein
MQIETKLEIQDAARRLIPRLMNAVILFSALCLLGSILMLVAVVIAASQSMPIAAVTDSGQVYPVPEVNKKLPTR